MCAGDSISVQCTVSGNIVTWNTPEGAINILRGRQSEGYAGSYQWVLEELDGNRLQSTISFTVTSLITMRCSDGTNSSETTISVEGK